MRVTREPDQVWYQWLIPWHAHYGDEPSGVVWYWLVWGFWFDETSNANEADE